MDFGIGNRGAEKRVAVVMPVYNDAAFVAASIQSVLNQTYTDFHFYIVDNGSTDGTRSVLQRFADDPRITIVRRNRNAHSQAAPDLIRSLRNEVLALIFSDDIWEPNKLARSMEFIWRAARVIDRRRFEFLFEGGSAQAVLDALRAYRNDDGGFGHGLEPDIRGPESQPLQVYAALLILDEIGRFDGPMLASALDFLVDGHRAGRRRARAWSRPAMTCRMPPGCPRRTLRDPARCCPPEASLGCCTSTASSIRGSHRPARSVGTRSAPSRRRIPMRCKFALAFLDHAPERERAEREAERLGKLVREQNLVIVDRATATDDMSPPGYAPGEFHYPLDYAQRPSSLARRWFTDREIEQNLAQLRAGTM